MNARLRSDPTAPDSVSTACAGRMQTFGPPASDGRVEAGLRGRAKTEPDRSWYKAIEIRQIVMTLSPLKKI